MTDEYNPSEGEDHPSDDETDAEGEGESDNSDRQLLYQELDRLVAQASQQPPDGFARKRYLSQIVTKMKNSGLIWKNHRNEPFYEDALQEQWVFFCSNLCEARTSTQYDRDRSNPITWFNNCLKWRLRTSAQKIVLENQRRASIETILEDGETTERAEVSEAVGDSHIIESIEYFQLVKNWIYTNPNGVLSQHIRGRKDVTCQVILKSLSSGKTFGEMATNFNCSYSTLKGFYNNKCRPILEEFRATCES
ncbi:hypothetical protein [Microcoleus sp. herbarium14]|uniref:hypothetical protein n=1 Tax=Microcoleus sp. herbarium14 TaxID=3055439 RepID=UPI002FD3AFC3